MAIQDSIKALMKNNTENYSIVAKVKSVDKNKRTCTVVPVSDADDKIFGVRLQAKREYDKGIVCYPAVDSEVVVTFENKQTGYVAMFSQIESYECIIDDKEFNFDGSGLLVKSAQGSLLSAWSDLLDILENFKVITQVNGSTATGTPITGIGTTTTVSPDVIAKITLLQMKIESILKDA